MENKPDWYAFLLIREKYVNNVEGKEKKKKTICIIKVSQNINSYVSMFSVLKQKPIFPLIILGAATKEEIDYIVDYWTTKIRGFRSIIVRAYLLYKYFKPKLKHPGLFKLYLSEKIPNNLITLGKKERELRREIIRNIDTITMGFYFHYGATIKRNHK